MNIQRFIVTSYFIRKESNDTMNLVNKVKTISNLYSEGNIETFDKYL